MTDTTNTQNKSTGKYWLMFVASVAAIVLITIFRPEAFWLPIPGLVTSFALANDWL